MGGVSPGDPSLQDKFYLDAIFPYVMYYPKESLAGDC